MFFLGFGKECLFGVFFFWGVLRVFEFFFFLRGFEGF